MTSAIDADITYNLHGRGIKFDGRGTLSLFLNGLCSYCCFIEGNDRGLLMS